VVDPAEDHGDARRCVEAFASARGPVLVVDAGGAVLAANRPELGGAALGARWTLLGEGTLLGALARVAESGSPSTVAVTEGDVVWQLEIAPLEIAPRSGATRALLVIGVDVTARQRDLERLTRSEALLVDASGVAHLGSWEWDVSQPSATWSDELYRIYGLTRETYTPSYEGYLAMVHEDDREEVKRVTERVFRDHEPYSHDERIHRPDGSIRYLHTWAQPVLDGQGKLLRLIGVCQDITDRKTAEIALAERAAELARSNARLQEEMAHRERAEEQLRLTHKLEAIGRLAGGIAHDFNNLLGVVVGRSSLLLRQLPQGDPMRESIVEIESVGRHGARLTQQLLAFSREEALGREVVDLGKMASELAQLLRRGLGEAVELVVHCTDPAPYVEGHRGQLDQIVMNLVVNARDAMPRGGRLTVEISPATGEALRDLPDDLDTGGGWVSLTVSDTGVGMNASVQARIFDPFFTTKDAGHGLGLSTVYGIVRRAGGAITVSSAPGEGSRFRVLLPRAAGRPPRAADLTPSARAGRSGTVLVVEDQEELRLLLRALLEDLGHDVLEASGPLEALDLLQQQPRVDLLLTDLLMPRMNGVELVARVRALGLPRVLPVLYVSGWADERLMSQLDDHETFLQKPFTQEELARALDIAMASRAPSDQGVATV
jgi:two-component system cell cycle sensor histidine kinase/response regulator CckA